VFVLISPEDCDTCECDECVVCFVEFVIASKNTPELFDITEITFYNVASFVQFLIIFPRFLAIALRRNHRTHPALFRCCTAIITFIRLVHEKRFALANLFRHLFHQLLTHGIVCRRTRGQLANNRCGFIGNDGVDFGRQASTTSANGLLPFFWAHPFRRDGL